MGFYFRFYWFYTGFQCWTIEIGINGQRINRLDFTKHKSHKYLNVIFTTTIHCYSQFYLIYWQISFCEVCTSLFKYVRTIL